MNQIYIHYGYVNMEKLRTTLSAKQGSNLKYSYNLLGDSNISLKSMPNKLAGLLCLLEDLA